MTRNVMHAPVANREDVGESNDAISRIERVFANQRTERWRMAATTAAERSERLRRLKRGILARTTELEAALMSDLHKHPAEVELTELQPALGEINHTIKHLSRWMRPQRVAPTLQLLGTRSEIRYEPKGVVLILAPWNYPFGLTINPLVAAIAAGNCVMIKPSEKAPATSRLLAELVRDVFDESEVALFEGDASVAEALLELPFDHVLFTGSTRIGKVVMTAAARHLASVTLELGGKSPVIVDASADIGTAARRVVWGKFINAGQTCVAPDYVLVPDDKRSAFLEAARRAVDASYGTTDEARKASPDFCRMVDDGAFARMQSLVEDAVSRGATVETGGAFDAGERYVAPTILANVAPEMAVMSEEIFGPILPVVPYRTLDEAIDFVRARPKPLALYVFADDRRTVERVLRETSAGGTAVNTVVLHLANPNLPFGGVGESGTGSYHGLFGFRAFSHERAILRQGLLSTVQRFFPPYTDAVRRNLLLLRKYFY
jgi:aldehyde dehydrogenase (NAD+)